VLLNRPVFALILFSAATIVTTLERPLLVVSGLLKTDREHLRTPNRRFARAKPEALFPALYPITTALRCQPLIVHSAGGEACESIAAGAQSHRIDTGSQPPMPYLFMEACSVFWAVSVEFRPAFFQPICGNV
jgi:hypothetical protein